MRNRKKRRHYIISTFGTGIRNHSTRLSQARAQAEWFELFWFEDRPIPDEHLKGIDLNGLDTIRGRAIGLMEKANSNHQKDFFRYEAERLSVHIMQRLKDMNREMVRIGK